MLTLTALYADAVGPDQVHTYAELQTDGDPSLVAKLRTTISKSTQ